VPKVFVYDKIFGFLHVIVNMIHKKMKDCITLVIMNLKGECIIHNILW